MEFLDYIGLGTGERSTGWLLMSLVVVCGTFLACRLLGLGAVLTLSVVVAVVVAIGGLFAMFALTQKRPGLR